MCNWISICNCICIFICIYGWQTGRVKVCLCTPAQSSEKCVLLGREGTSCASPCFIAGEVFVGRGLDLAGWAQHMESILYLCLCNCVCTNIEYKYKYKNSWRGQGVCRAGPRSAGWAQPVAPNLYFYLYLCICTNTEYKCKNKNSWLGVFGLEPPPARWTQPSGPF